MNSFTLELLLQNPANYQRLYSQSLDLVICVKKAIDRFVYQKEVLDNAVPLYYLASNELSTDNNLVLVNRTYGVKQNSKLIVTSRSDWDFTKAKTYTSPYRDILATNKTFLDRNGKLVPLFYRHKLTGAARDIRIQKITNRETSLISSGWYHDQDTEYLYTSFKNQYNPDTGEYELYYLNYNTELGGENEFLNLDKACTEATWEDIDFDTGRLKTDVSTYAITQGSSGWTFNFSQAGPWYIKPYDYSLIQPSIPSLGAKDPWFLRVTYGDFYAVVNSETRHYKVTEYQQQSFIPYEPYRFSIPRELRRIKSDCYQTPYKNIYVDSLSSLDVHILFYDQDMKVVRAITSDPSLEGTRYRDTGIFWESDKIKGVDEFSGIIVLTCDIPDKYRAYGSFYYRSKEVEYNLVALNPLYNKDMKDKQIIVYLVPDVEDADKSIHYLLVDQSGKIVYTSQDDNGIGYPNLSLLNADNTYNPNTVIGKYYKSELETDTFTNLFLAGYENNYGYMLLAELSCNLHTMPEDIIRIDVRDSDIFDMRYDQLKEVLIKNSNLLYSSYLSTDGVVIPKNNILVIQVPLSVLEDYGGYLTETQVQNYLQSNLPSDVTLVIDYIWPVSEITVLSDIVGEVTISGTWEGPDLTYKFYRYDNNLVSGEVIDIQVNPIEGTVSYTDLGLVSGSVYYYAIALVKDGVEYPVSDKIAVMVR